MHERHSERARAGPVPVTLDDVVERIDELLDDTDLPPGRPAYGPQAEACRRSRCIACYHSRRRNRGRVLPHHLRTRGAGGRDEATVPLCEPCHDELHNEGRVSFWQNRGISWSTVLQALLCVRRGVPWDEMQALPW